MHTIVDYTMAQYLVFISHTFESKITNQTHKVQNKTTSTNIITKTSTQIDLVYQRYLSY